MLAVLVDVDEPREFAFVELWEVNVDDCGDLLEELRVVQVAVQLEKGVKEVAEVVLVEGG